MVKDIKGLVEVDYSCHCVQQRLLLVKAFGDEGGEREEGGDSGAVWGKAMLVWGAREGGKKGVDKLLKNFRGRAKERNGAVRCANVRGFIGLKDGDNEGVFP